MLYSEMTKEQKRELKIEYKKIFGEQVYPMKSLFISKEDPILLDELLNNVSESLYKLMISDQLNKVEVILEKMNLSVLEYEAVIFRNERYSEHEMHIMFFSNFQIVTFSDMTIRNANDLKKVILMIMHVGVQYDTIYQTDQDVDKHLDEYRLLDGFDQNIDVAIITENQEKISVN